MSTLAENAAAIKAAQVAIDAAIVAKGGTTAGGLTNAAAAIRAIPSGGGSTAHSDVNFYMPDGTIAKSYTAAEFAGLSALPDQPAISGLTAQGWNWTLADAKAYVASYGKLDIGGMYVTDNGETRLYITIAEPYRLEQPLRFGRSGGTGITVDWGDGSEPVTYTHTSQTIVKHSYLRDGDYVIRMSPVGSAKLLLVGSSTYNIFGSRGSSVSSPTEVFSSRLRKVEIGSSVTSIGTYVFSNCNSLLSVAIPSSVTSIGTYAFTTCYSLSSVVIPSSVTSVGGNTFNYCFSLSSVAIPSSVTSIGTYAFYNCHSLSSVAIPSSVTSIGSNAFGICHSLSSVAIPSSVTIIDSSAFNECRSLSSVAIPSSVTSIGTNAFKECRSLSSVVIPSSVTSIGTYAFTNCYSLSSVVIPSSVTSIGNSVFVECSSLSSVVIPSSVTSIDAFAFYKCHCVAKYDFTEHTQVPALSNVNAFSEIATDCKIVVPDALYDTWVASTNWSGSTIVGHIVKASEYVED